MSLTIVSIVLVQQMASDYSHEIIMCFMACHLKVDIDGYFLCGHMLNLSTKFIS